MAGRPKTPTRELLTRDDANGAIRDLLHAQIELEKQQGALDLARAAATSKFEKDIDVCKSFIADLTAQLQTWYLVCAERPAGRKSITLAYGTVGERVSPPSLHPLNRKWNWKAIGAKLAGTYGAKFFHPADAPKPDKDKIRAELNDEQLKDCGLKVEHEETFYVELDRSSLGDSQ